MPSAARDFASVNLASILRSVTATLSQGGTEHSLASEQFDRPVSEKKFAVAVTKVSGVKEAPAVLPVTARETTTLRMRRRPRMRSAAVYPGGSF